jgi:alkylglycerol monooxygenase
VPPVYGVKRPVHTWNPFKINFQHFWLMLTDAWRTRSWWDKLRLWFMPTGWRPADVQARYPVAGITDVYHFEKYDTRASRTLVAWSWIQMFFNYFLLIYFFAFIGKIGSPGIFLYGAFIFASIYAYTELMDRNRYAQVFEIAKSALGLYLIWQSGGDWFGAKANVGAWYVYAVGAWCVLSVGAVVWLAEGEVAKDNSVPSWHGTEA